MLEIVLLRALLLAAPFAAWFAWVWWARRTGRAMGATPWAWLFAAGAVLVALSLMGTVVFHRDNRGETYVPGEVTSDGRVSEGRYEETPAKAP